MLKSKKALIVILLIIILAIAAGFVFVKPRITSNSSSTQENVQPTEEQQSGQNVLDCSEKVAQDGNSSQVAQGDVEKESNCLFLGCGDFF